MDKLWLNTQFSQTVSTPENLQSAAKLVSSLGNQFSIYDIKYQFALGVVKGRSSLSTFHTGDDPWTFMQRFHSPPLSQNYRRI